VLGCAPVLAAEPREPSADPPKLKSEPFAKPNRSGKKTTMGDDIKRFGEQVASRIDRIVKKKSFDMWDEPWTMQGIPLIFPSSDNGFNVGLRLQLQDIKRQDPHKYEVIAQVLASDAGRYKHLFLVDIPHALDDKLRFTARVQYDRDISIPFFGLGNDTVADRSQLGKTDLYRYVRSSPTIRFDFLRRFGKNWRLGPLIGFQWMNIAFPAGSLMDQQKPFGYQGGNSHYFGFAVVRDTLDFEPYPSRGGVDELYFYWYNKFLGSDYEFRRVTYTYRRYLMLHRRLILAHRTLFEFLDGDVPFYELGAVGGSNPALALGGSRFFRGYQDNRFTDKVRLDSVFELRWDPMFFAFAKQDITVGLVPFFDIGRVWPRLIPFELGTWHASTGVGARMIWNSRLVIRGDMAVTQEGTAFYVDINNSF
jgi:outer membrane protein assembly factor BamA